MSAAGTALAEEEIVTALTNPPVDLWTAVEDGELGRLAGLGLAEAGPTPDPAIGESLAVILWDEARRPKLPGHPQQTLSGGGGVSVIIGSRFGR